MRSVFALSFVLVLAACGDGTADETTTTTAEAEDTTTTTVEDTTTAEETTTTSTTVAEETTTTAAEGTEATGDLATLQAAMAASAEATPSRMEGSMAFTLPGGETAEMPMSMMVDAETGDSSMSMDMTSMAQMGGAEDVPPEMAEMMGSMEVRQIGETVYMSFPFFTAFLGAETEWISMPAEEEDEVAGEMTPGATPSDPTEFLESLQDVEGSVEELGTEEIRGTTTTHYRLMVNEDWQEGLSEEEVDELEEQGPLPDASFPLDLWVDSDGMVHRMMIDIQGEDLAATEVEDIEGMTMTFDFFDFGESVTIEAPPADQVTDMSELSGPLGTFEQP